MQLGREAVSHPCEAHSHCLYIAWGDRELGETPWSNVLWVMNGRARTVTSESWWDEKPALSILQRPQEEGPGFRKEVLTARHPHITPSPQAALPTKHLSSASHAGGGIPNPAPISHVNTCL